MKIVKLYNYKRADGGTTVSLNKPDEETAYTEMQRLIADEGKLLTDGTYITPCIDVYSAEGWTEIIDPKTEETEETEEAGETV